MTTDTWHLPDPETQPEFYADVPLKRALAFAVDSLITLGLCLLVLPFTVFTGLFFFPLLFLSLGLIYRTATIAQGSATWGMRLMAVELRTMSGQRLSPTLALWHSFAFTFSCGVPVFLLGSMLMIVTTQRGQSLGDMILGTVALNRRAGG